jgi:hypothetical protein
LYRDEGWQEKDVCVIFGSQVTKVQVGDEEICPTAVQVMITAVSVGDTVHDDDVDLELLRVNYFESYSMILEPSMTYNSVILEPDKQQKDNLQF